MPLVIETGAGVQNADSWVSLEDVDQYWDARDTPEWAAADEDRREAKLREAADYLTIAYRYPGQPTTIGQRLPWPRTGVPSGLGIYPSNAIPTQIISAQMVLAVEALNTPLLRKPAAVDRQVIEETKKAKGFEKTLKYAAGPVDAVSGLARFAVVDAILQGIVKSGISGDFGTAKLVKRI